MSKIRTCSDYDKELLKNQFLNITTTKDATMRTLQGVKESNVS